MQSLQHMVPHYLSCPQRSVYEISSLLFPSPRQNNQVFVNGLIHKSSFFRSSTFIGCYRLHHNLRNVVCKARFNEFPNEDSSKGIEDLSQRFYINEKFLNQFSPPRFDFLDPSSFGISMWYTPEWPEDDEIDKVIIESKANSLEIPVSLRMIRRKQKYQEGFSENITVKDFNCCSAKKAFSSMVFIIRELQSHALQIREDTCSSDLEGIVKKMQREMNASFVWLFQQVFSRTPILMVHVMILLANFTIHSLANQTLVVANQPSTISNKTISEEKMILKEIKNQNQPNIEPSSAEKSAFSSSSAGNNSEGESLGEIDIATRDGDSHLNNPLPSIQFPNQILQAPMHVLEEGEKALWNSVVEEASRLQSESRDDILDHQTVQQFVSPFTVQMEPDDYEEYFRTDLMYQMGLAKEPNNPLLLLNYAQFLNLVAKDHDRAEECFKRAIQLELPDPEALSLYADFLWRVRDELWDAEETYQQAMEAAPKNPYYTSKYANFLWSTGGEETCFPPVPINQIA
ncbi:uncharacterized protein LOC110819290 [Carica papaya]|uniref:uncharacterized protein LOC110819290 n=1 Tax=Carica papaya TaxID=3649 RepID=UPI000B8C7E40|nr:uncharacterized protein LOC110819290 [Carica papaya]XP_021904114.1 uncharacterized protein LOC110819290 [Carica papaya]